METGLTIIQDNKPKAVTIRRSIVANPKNIAFLEPIEQSVYLATTERTVEEYNDVELLNEFQKVLYAIAKDIGIRDTRNEDWKITNVRIMKIAQRYYPTFTIKDFRFAFELAVTGELNDYLPKDRFGNPDKEHYQMFNAEYFCKIVNAYKVYRNDIIKRVNDTIPQEQPQRNPEHERMYEIRTNKDILGFFLCYKYRGYIPAMSPIMEILTYDRLSKIGFAEDIEVTEQEQQYVLKQTIFELSKKQMFGDVKRLKEQQTNAPEIQHPAFRLSRKKAIKRTFDELIKEEIQLKEFLKWD